MGHHSSEAHGKSRGHAGKSSSSDKHADKHRSSKSSKSDSKDAPGSPHELTFLFVVNQLNLNEVHPTIDQWGTEIPPDDPGSYADEIPGQVFRYVDGRVEPAPQYTWIRHEGLADVDRGLRYQGEIMYHHHDGLFYSMPEYRTCAVFNCWRPLPCVFVDADPMSTPAEAYGNSSRWCLMGFGGRDGTGITRISRGGGGSQVVNGRHPTWMPSLVPAMFGNTAPGTPHSVGLAGSLSVIIGRMALAYPPGRTDRPFERGMWDRGRWTGAVQQEAEVSQPDGIRGVLVHIALDTMFPDFSQAHLLEALESEGCIIRG